MPIFFVDGHKKISHHHNPIKIGDLLDLEQTHGIGSNYSFFNNYSKEICLVKEDFVSVHCDRFECYIIYSIIYYRFNKDVILSVVVYILYFHHGVCFS